MEKKYKVGSERGFRGLHLV